MARVTKSSDIDNILKLYQSGLSLKDVAMRVGVNVKTADKHIRNSGIPKRTMAEAHALAGVKLRRRDMSHLERSLPNEAVALYESGIGVKEIARRLNACAKRISRQLREAGVVVNGHNTVVRRFGPDASRQWAKAASNVAIVTHDNLCQRATSRQSTGCLVGVMETEFSEEFSARGLEVTQQFAVGSYNVDIALDKHRVAVEIHRGSWHGATSAMPKRLEYLFDRGWRVVFIQISRHGATTDIGAITDQLIAALDQSSGNPSPRGQYGVLRRNGQPAARLPDYFNRWPRIPGL